MKRGLWICSLLLVLTSLRAFAEDSEEVVTLSAGKLVLKTQTEVFSKDCQAKRVWPVLSGLPSKAVEEKLNAKFRKIMTVDRKLKKADCPNPDFKENYEYWNKTIVGASRGDYLGLEFIVYFPGGSGRVVHDCRIFNLKDGTEVNLNKQVAKGAFEYGQKILKERLPSETIDANYEPRGLLPGDSPQAVSAFCLDKEGLSLLRSPNEMNRADRVALKTEDLSHLFKKSSVVDTLMKTP